MENLSFMTRFPNKMKDIKLNEIPVAAVVVKFSMPWKCSVRKKNICYCHHLMRTAKMHSSKSFAKHMSVIIVNSPNN